MPFSMDNIDNLIAKHKEAGDTARSDISNVKTQLKYLGISEDSQFGHFFTKHCITFFVSNVSNEELMDLTCPNDEIAVGTDFIREVWELPEEYICLTSCEGEGGYLYNREDGAVYDFDLAKRDDFLNGNKVVIASTFYGFIEWYLGT